MTRLLAMAMCASGTWRQTRILLALAASAVGLGICLGPAHGHGFGQRYELPLPLSFYLFAAAAAVVASFLVAGFFIRKEPPLRSHARFDLRSTTIGRLFTQAEFLYALKLLTLAAFILTILAGFRGEQDPYKNIAPTLVWVIWWVGFAYLSAIAGNLWEFLNPWRTLFEALESIYQGLTGRSALTLKLSYPARLGIWPAFILLLAFSWIELVYPNAAVPRSIARLALAYSALTFLGMFLFGCEVWLRHGEVFTQVFGLFGRLAPVELRANSIPSVALRPIGAGLVESGPVSNSAMAFVLLLLSTVLFDGLLGSPEWGMAESAVASALSWKGDAIVLLIRTAGLALSWLIFCSTFIAVSAVMSAVTGSMLKTLETARSFALSLVPIVAGYHVAHYLSYLLIQGQYIIPLLSDPFGFGWNLFGTAAYRVDINIVGPRFEWYTAVTAIVLGHIAAVYLAHIKALQLYPLRSFALRSQVPLTALMVVYTLVSLSILAEPIAQSRAPAQPTNVSAGGYEVPADALIPEPVTGRLLPLGRGRMAKNALTYRVLASSFHDGSAMSAADLFYAYMFAYRWSDRAAPDRYDPYVERATASLRRRLVAFKLKGIDAASKSFRVGDVNFVRELFVIEVYTSTTPLSSEQDAAIAPPWSTIPWHLLVLMEEAVTRGWAAFSAEEAGLRGIPWLDLVRYQDLKDRLAALVRQFKAAGYRPEPLLTFVSEGEARKRWAALEAFYEKRGHFLATNGPYELESWGADAVTLNVFRDVSYPLGVGSFDVYAVPRQGLVTGFERSGDHIKLFADIEIVMKHARSYDIVRMPLQSMETSVLKRSAPECRYLFMSSKGEAVLAGQVAAAEDAAFHVDLSGRLLPGLYTLIAQVIVNGNAMNSELKTIAIPVPATHQSSD
jgi:hypothetical protein